MCKLIYLRLVVVTPLNLWGTINVFNLTLNCLTESPEIIYFSEKVRGFCESLVNGNIFISERVILFNSGLFESIIIYALFCV